MQAEQSERATLQQQLREARLTAAQAAAAAPAAAQQQQQLEEQTAAVARLQQQLTEAQVTGSMRELHPALNVAAAHMLTIVAAHCHVKSDRVFSERGKLKSSLKGGLHQSVKICAHLVMLSGLLHLQALAWQGDNNAGADRQQLTNFSLPSTSCCCVRCLMQATLQAAQMLPAAQGTCASWKPLPTRIPGQKSTHQAFSVQAMLQGAEGAIP